MKYTLTENDIKRIIKETIREYIEKNQQNFANVVYTYDKIPSSVIVNIIDLKI